MQQGINLNTTQETPSSRLPRWISYPLLTWFLIGAIPILSLKTGYQYLPSPEWVSQVQTLASVSGIVTAVLLVWMVYMGKKIKNQKIGDAYKIFVLPFGFYMGLVMGSSAITMGGPMVGAMIAGSETEIPYMVTKYKREFNRGCRYPITLDGMPWMFEKLCGFSEEFGRSIVIGKPILIKGRGTEIGVFVESARQIN